MNSGSFDALRCLTKSTMPPAYLNVTGSWSWSGRSSRKRISRPLLRNAIIWQPLEERAGAELDGLEDRGVGPERDGGAGAAAGRVADDLELGLRLAAVGELDAVALAVAVDLDDRAGSTAR